MKRSLLIAMLLVICIAGCKNKSTKDLENKIATLEKLVKEKEGKIITLAISLKAMSKDLSHFDQSGTWNFFNSKDFWETTYPVTECRDICAKNFMLSKTQCQTILDSVERAKCMKGVYSNLISCTLGCE